MGVNAYVLTFGGFLLLAGAWRTCSAGGALHGGAVVVAVASLSRASPPARASCAARGAQGLGAAIIAPSALSIGPDLPRRLEATRRGAWGAVAAQAERRWCGRRAHRRGMGLGRVCGCTVPVDPVSCWPSPRADSGEPLRSQTRHFDAAGAFTVTAGSPYWSTRSSMPKRRLGVNADHRLLAASVVLLATFTAIELRSDAPLVPFSIFRKRTLTGANAVGLMVGGSLFAMFFFVTLYMQQVLGYSPIKAGLSYLPLSVAIIASAGVASQLVTKVGFKPVLAAGLALVARACSGSGQISVGGSFTTDILGPSLRPHRAGLRLVTTTIAAVLGHRGPRAGAGERPDQSAQQIGGALGLAVWRPGHVPHGRSPRRGGRRPRSGAGRPGRGLSVRFPRRGGDRPGRAGTDLRAHSGQRQPRPRGSRRRGQGTGRRIERSSQRRTVRNFSLRVAEPTSRCPPAPEIGPEPHCSRRHVEPDPLTHAQAEERHSVGGMLAPDRSTTTRVRCPRGRFP